MTPSGPGATFLAGVRDMSPVVLGAAPFGVVYGVAAVSSGMAEGPALAMSVVVFAGAAQLAGVGLLAENAQLAVIWLTVFVIHLRYVMYSAALAPHFQGLPKRWKALLAYPMTDQAFALSIVRFQKNPDDPARHLYYLGNALTLWPAWVASSAVGIFLGAQIPARWGLEFAVPLAFLAVIFPSISDRASAVAAAVAGVVAVVAYGLPYNLNLMLAAIFGIAAGLYAERNAARSTERPAQPETET